MMEEKEEESNAVVVLMEFSSHVLKSREDMFRQHLLNMSDGSFSDVTFVVGEMQTKIYGVRSVLAAISPVFKAMLYGEMQEREISSEIKIPDCCPQAFKSIIKYSHGIDPQISIENCLEVRWVSEKYQITSLATHLDNFISESVNLENFCTLLNAAVQIPNSILSEKVLESLEQLDSMLFLSSETFVHSISVASLQILLQSENFQVPEEYLWERCLQWANYQACTVTAEKNQSSNELKSSRKEFLSQIYRYMRFPLMTPSYIMNKVHPSNLLEGSELAAVLADVSVGPQGGGPWSTFSSVSRIKSEEKDWKMWARYLTVGAMIDAKDSSNTWFAAKIIEKYAQHVKVHYQCWGPEFNATIALSPNNIQPLYTKTSNWVLQLRKGTELEVLQVVNGKRTWFLHQALEVDAEARRVLVLNSSKVGQDQKYVDANSRWVDMDSEEINYPQKRNSR
mmetsp:Transcript_305/g.567  ORF Transcript_305/g.567 Transcript_305/m.567 type:complete len:452 (+) Transcript_305:137-1492(+)